MCFVLFSSVQKGKKDVTIYRKTASALRTVQAVGECKSTSRW